MGLVDTDFMREGREDERQFRRRFGSREWSATSIAAASFLVLALASAAYLAWDSDNRTAPTTSTPTPTTSTAASAVVRNAPARLSVARVPSNTVFKCKTGKGTTYVASPSECPKEAIVSRVGIDPDQNLSDGLHNAARIIREPSPYAQTAAIESPSDVDPNVQRKATCEAYEQEIKVIDARARQPLSAQEQDWLATKRHKVRDAQFRLHC